MNDVAVILSGFAFGFICWGLGSGAALVINLATGKG